MGKHDQKSHFLHLPKQLKFKQDKPSVVNSAQTAPRMQKLGDLNRRG